MQKGLNRTAPFRDLEQKNRSYAFLLLVYLAGYVAAAIYTPLFALNGARVVSFLWEETIPELLFRMLFPLLIMLLLALHPMGICMIPMVFGAKGFSDGCQITSVIAQLEGLALYQAFLTIGAELLYYFLPVAWFGAWAHCNSFRLYRGEVGIQLRNIYILFHITPIKNLILFVIFLTAWILYRIVLIPLLLT